MKITIENGQRPSWLKDTDIILRRYYGSFTAERSKAFATGQNTKFPHFTCFCWGAKDLNAIEIDDTHPYAVATSQGFTYNDGSSNSAPTDGDPSKSVLFRDGQTGNYPSGSEWHHPRAHYPANDIIGYHVKVEPKPFEIYMIKAEVEFTVNTVTEARATEVALEVLEDDHFEGVKITSITKFDPNLVAARGYLASVYPKTAAAIFQGDFDSYPTIRHFLAGRA